ERIHLRVPAAGHHRPIETVALGQPAGVIRRKRTFPREPYAAIQCYPALHLGIGEVAARTAHFPDTLIGPVPVGGYPVEQTLDVGPHIVGERLAILVVEV